MVLAAAMAAGPVVVGQFSQGRLEGWQREVFAGETRYQIVSTARGRVLRAVSEDSASGLYKPIEVDLTETPYLHWSWRVEGVFSGNDETRKSGDDYPARLYVVISHPILFWRTRALNYVWASHQPVGASWSNAFTDNAQMLAVESGAHKVGQWVSERRDVRADLRRAFGEDFDHIDAVALMTDSDNTHGAATADYGDIYFSAR